jgi:hypothetical protein
LILIAKHVILICDSHAPGTSDSRDLQAISTSAKSHHWDVAIGVLGSMVFKAWRSLISLISLPSQKGEK